MLFILLKPTERANRYLNRDNIDIHRLQTMLNFVAGYIDTRKKVENVTITLDIDCRKADSEYNFVSKHVLIAGIGQNHKKIKTRRGRLKYLIEHLVHEFRHCMQEVVFRKDASEVTYDSTDDEQYNDNPLEKDANWFEDKFNRKALDLYRLLKKYRVRNATWFHDE